MSAAPTRSHDDVGSTPAVWLVSLAIHGLLILLVATNSGSWFGGQNALGVAPEEGDDFRNVGVVLKPTDSPDAEESDDSPEADPAEDSSDASASATFDGPVVPDAPPVEIDLPRANDRALGSSGLTAPPMRAPGDVADVVRAGNGNLDRIPGGGLVAGETRFFGIKDKGVRIVYLIDKSGSMGGPKLAAAKSQLLASLETLTDEQQFQVVFYNHGQFPMELVLPSRDAQQRSLFRAQGVYAARSLNKTLTRQYLGSVRADEGTDREAALMLGLKYEPDVLYFLTDGDGVELDAKKRSRIKERSDGRTRIHCIEFGTGPAPTVRTPLKRLAADNDGLYRFVPVGNLR